MKKENRICFFLLIAISIFTSSCIEENDSLLIDRSPWVKYGSMSDKDGNTYKTILIGTKTWMATNLSTTKYNDGTSIPQAADPTLWSKLSTPACCWQNSDPIRKVTYGVLYNWYAVNTGKLCPSGWHVPSDEEWTEFTDNLGGENVAGGKLKESGFKHWNAPNTEATNETHFSAIPGGDRLSGPDALFENLGNAGCWWTMTVNEDLATSRIIYYNSNHVQKSFYPRKCGLSVRCVWNYQNK
jgi:uncharacterized protein (TIGR02145 family)